MTLHVYHTPTPWKYLYPLFFYCNALTTITILFSHLFFFNAAFHDNISTIIFYSGTLHATLLPFFCCSRSLFILHLFILFFYCFHLSSIFSYPHFNDYTASIYPLSPTLISMTCIASNYYFLFVSFLHLDEFLLSIIYHYI